MDQWDVQRSGGRCCGSNRELAPGEEYYAALVDADGSFTRADYSQEYWDAQHPEVFSFWKTRVPQPSEKGRLFVDDRVLLDLFERLGNETEPLRVNFRFVLTLILMRKRLLKYEQTRHEADREIWLLRRSGTTDVYEVVNPQLDEAQIQQVSDELSTILHAEL